MPAESRRLHVKLSASQVRKRLKGHGFGVRHVEATGKGEAAIVHTATGGNLRRLQALFRDVLVNGCEEVNHRDTEATERGNHESDESNE